MELVVKQTQKCWAMTCKKCGGFVLLRDVHAGEKSAPELEGRAHCVRCNEWNDVANAVLFVIDGQRLRRISLNSPSDYVK